MPTIGVRPLRCAHLQLRFFCHWVLFYGNNKRELQIGNAVPVRFTKRIAGKVREALEVMDGHGESAVEVGEQMRMF